jgi:hypothetical protein
LNSGLHTCKALFQNTFTFTTSFSP